MGALLSFGAPVTTCSAWYCRMQSAIVEKGRSAFKIFMAALCSMETLYRCSKALRLRDSMLADTMFIKKFCAGEVCNLAPNPDKTVAGDLIGNKNKGRLVMDRLVKFHVDIQLLFDIIFQIPLSDNSIIQKRY